MIEFEDVTKRYPDGTVAVDNLVAADPEQRDHRARRAVRLRQDHLAADDQPDDRAHGRAGSRSTARTSATADAAELRRGIGYVIQHGGLFPHRTVLDNVATVPRLLGWDKREAPRRGRWSCSSGSGCDAELGQAIPGAALRWPAAACRRGPGAGRRPADHADGRAVQRGRPGRARRACRRSCCACRRELGKTIVFVTHDIDEAIKLGDKVAVLRVGGKLAQFGTPSELLADPADEFVAELRRHGTAVTAALYVRARPTPSSCCRCRRRSRSARTPIGRSAGTRCRSGGTSGRAASRSARVFTTSRLAARRLDAVAQTSPVGQRCRVDATRAAPSASDDHRGLLPAAAAHDDVGTAIDLDPRHLGPARSCSCQHVSWRWCRCCSGSLIALPLGLRGCAPLGRHHPLSALGGSALLAARRWPCSILLPVILGTEVLSPINIIVAADRLYGGAADPQRVDGLRLGAPESPAGGGRAWATAAPAALRRSTCRSPYR